MIRHFIAGCAVAAALVASPAMATEFVKNGDFSQLNSGTTDSRQMSSSNSVAYSALVSNSATNQRVSYWTSLPDGCNLSGCSVNSQGNITGAYAGYNFIFKSGDPVATNNGGTDVTLWGADGTYSNGFKTSKNGTGGNYVASDGAYQTGFIAQTVSGLTVGQKYLLTFDFAGAQQKGYTGATTEGWNVIFTETDFSNTQNYATTVLQNQSQGFTGWQSASVLFTATDTTQILGFIANGTPDGKPPFTLLDNVSLTNYTAPAVPEPATWAMMLAGFGFIGTTMRRKRFGELWKV